MQDYSPAWPHSAITEILTNIFFVTGMNKTHHNGLDLQHSRNMVIVRNNHQLSLINTVRLDDIGLATLDALGTVENIIRIGSFHGRDDAFYLDRYHSKLWAIKGMVHSNNRLADIELSTRGQMPFPKCSFFLFETSQFAEGILHIALDGGILITCDSVKNWISSDAYFSEKTARLYQKQGFFGPASISNVWRDATKVQASDFVRIKSLSFRHLISAHGVPILNNAHEQLAKAIDLEFSV